MLPLDLHVLSLPLAFILSQDQTLHSNFFIYFTNPKVSYIIIKTSVDHSIPLKNLHFKKNLFAITYFIFIIVCSESP